MTDQGPLIVIWPWQVIVSFLWIAGALAWFLVWVARALKSSPPLDVADAAEPKIALVAGSTAIVFTMIVGLGTGRWLDALLGLVILGVTFSAGILLLRRSRRITRKLVEKYRSKRPEDR